MYKKQNEEKQNNNKGNYAKKGNTAHKSGNKVVGDRGRTRERLAILHINTSQYSKIFLLNELKFKQYVFYNKIKTAWFNTKIRLG